MNSPHKLGAHHLNNQWPQSGNWRFSQRLVLPLLLATFVLGCTRGHSFRVADVTKTNQFALASRFGEFVSGISLHVAGKLDGSAILVLSGQTTQTISGVIDWKTYEHLRTSNCVLSYYPQTVTGGRLQVDYVFH